MYVYPHLMYIYFGDISLETKERKIENPSLDKLMKKQSMCCVTKKNIMLMEEKDLYTYKVNYMKMIETWMISNGLRHHNMQRRNKELKEYDLKMKNIYPIQIKKIQCLHRKFITVKRGKNSLYSDYVNLMFE